jgi:hypothetical protein
MRRTLKADKLSDELGQYDLLLTCGACDPETLALLCDWDARLSDVMKRLRCSKCDERRCTGKVFPLDPPRGYKSH